MVTVTLYSRQGCHLCESAAETLGALRDELAFTLETLFIDGNQELEKLYGTQVPVIHINGEHHDFFRVDPERFRTCLEKYRLHQ
jgi:glutaredoxin